MKEKEMLYQIRDLIQDRKSFLTKDEEDNIIIKKDIKALNQILNNYKSLKGCCKKLNKKVKNQASSLTFLFNKFKKINKLKDQLIQLEQYVKQNIELCYSNEDCTQEQFNIWNDIDTRIQELKEKYYGQ